MSSFSQTSRGIFTVSEVSHNTSQFSTCKYSAVATVCTNLGLFGQADRDCISFYQQETFSRKHSTEVEQATPKYTSIKKLVQNRPGYVNNKY